MFKDIQKLFQQSMAAFRAELSRREPEDQVAELLSAMRRELVAVRATLPLLREEAQRARTELERERELLRQCERRGALAEGIGDVETVRIAAEFAERHRERVAVMEQRIAAAEAEQALRQREAEEMRRKYEEADANRFALVAQLRRAETQQKMRSRLDGSSGAFADFARMEEAVGERAGYVDALDALDDAGPTAAPPPAPDVEERLRQLKERMGRQE